ncbi:hypothetical protein M9H77_17850 [Catharanthus roseus]|uniref:Uncharacterized protein n=1 Tax=Catharanthus roseus TaxID=4058 RepID=A0ACC0B5S3_CATRO|nr:hypothetical protein M9H77_17850 [Catharanthus roseus]
MTILSATTSRAFWLYPSHWKKCDSVPHHWSRDLPSSAPAISASETERWPPPIPYYSFQKSSAKEAYMTRHNVLQQNMVLTTSETTLPAAVTNLLWDKSRGGKMQVPPKDGSSKYLRYIGKVGICHQPFGLDEWIKNLMESGNTSSNLQYGCGAWNSIMSLACMMGRENCSQLGEMEGEKEK